LEGPHDWLFLKQVASVLHQTDRTLPDLRDWEATGRCLFIPAGGGDAAAWTLRLPSLTLPQFYLFDRESHDVGQRRGEHVRLLNLVPYCRAALTSKRSLENYLHPQVIDATLGITLPIDDDTDVAGMAASAVYSANRAELTWENLPPRSRKRRRDRIKHLLNGVAVLEMTADLLAQRDPTGEIRGWLSVIGDLASHT